MITIVDFVKRQNREGQEFIALILQSGIELVKTKETGRNYIDFKLSGITENQHC
jgi:hypothetical protein